MNQRGLIDILILCLIFIFCVVAVFVAVLVGLNNMQEKEFSQSLFNNQAKIRPIMNSIEKQKDDLVAEIKNIRDNNDLGEVKKHRPLAEGATSEERLDDVKDRLANAKER